ncbi:MAG: valine--tRNA ligase [Planctomycetes bacterium]|nr:valine--tRNA ligase [Planctomycetota bacterium]
MAEPLSPRYEPATLEGRLYAAWESSGHFSPDARTQAGAQPFVIVIPPPNVTGHLHMGHGFQQTFQDVSIRFERMRGKAALWLPGTDHAGIATQNVVEKELKKQGGKRRQDLGREAFVTEVWKWKEQYEKRICTQMRAIGQSLDWSRYAFTMDERLSRAVRVAFCTLWERGLVYRGKRIVNWCPRCLTALSDEEAEKQPSKGHLWRFKYPVKGMSGRTVTIATTRPETMLGDVAVAVNPKDERYADLVGKTLVLPIVGREIPIVADDAVEREFGTGAVKVTPAHDPTDFEIGDRHKLERTVIMTPEAKITLEALGGFAGAGSAALQALAGLDRFDARKKIVETMEALGLLDGADAHENAVGRCYRCDTVVEPYLSDQWFVKMSVLAKKAADAQRRSEITFTPARWESFYLSWLDNARDWCVSRQIWWGHRVPVWWCEACNHMNVPKSAEATTDPTRCEKCGSSKLRQDEDVFDTWFSSWLWPFSTLGWPDKTADLETYYPTDLLVTGRDIIFFWVARMVMAGLEFTGKVPFRGVYINGTVLDAQGRKMSKSLNNGIDPIEMIQEYGADAVRYSLMILTKEGQDLKLAKEKFVQGRNFCNKVWNAARFIGMSLDGAPKAAASSAKRLEDRWIRSRRAATVDAVTKALAELRYGDAAEALYRFTWNDFCDHYLEAVKGRLDSDGADREEARAVLLETLEATIRLLHPFVPFLTEELYAGVVRPSLSAAAQPMLLNGPWPSSEPAARDEQAERETEILRDAIRATRNLRAVFNFPASSKPGGAIYSAANAASEEVLRANSDLLRELGRVADLKIGVELPRPQRSGVDVFEGGALYLPLEGQVDVAAGVEQLKKKAEKLEAGLRAVDAKLANEKFVANADAEIVEAERTRRAELAKELALLNRNLEGLQ